jgi:hypothetical protein
MSAALMVAGRNRSAMPASERCDCPMPRVRRTGFFADLLKRARLGGGLGQRREREQGRGKAPEQEATRHQGLLGSGFRQPRGSPRSLNEILALALTAG